MFVILFLWLGLLSAAATCIAAPSIGIFDGQTTIGTHSKPGSSSFGANRTFYTVTGGGEKLWGASDGFHFLWKRVKGDCSISADIEFAGDNNKSGRKAVLMFRQSLAANAPYADAAFHGSGFTALQFRVAPDGETLQIHVNGRNHRRLRLEKRGDHFYLYTSKPGEEPEFSGASFRLPLQEPFYVGIGVSSHTRDFTETAAFSSVSLKSLPRSQKRQFRSTLETIQVASHSRRALMVFNERVTAPSWTSNGDIVYKRGGRYERLQPTSIPPAPTGGPKHGYRYFASRQTGNWQIWRSRLDGSNPEQITHDSLENIGPQLSPDGKHLAFLSYPRGTILPAEDTEAQLRLIDLEGPRTPVLLALFLAGKYSLAEPAWSPHGARLAFVSYHLLP